MSYSAIIWLILNLLSIIVLAFYSMLEMACVSFNKVRLQYYVSKGIKRTLWLNYLLQHPSRLFGTTLIGVNIALVIGSECSREFYSAIGLSPDIAPLTQVILVVIFGELAPMFAARRYPEHVAMLGIPLIYASAKLMTPLLIIIDWITRFANLFIKDSKNEANIYLTEEELVKIIEEQSDRTSSEAENDEFSTITANIFSLREKDVKQVMKPIINTALLPSNATVDEMEALLTKTGATFISIFHRDISNIIGIVYPRDAIRAAGTKRARDYAWPPWFVTETTGMMQILKQFRTNNETVAVILNQSGHAIGIVTLDDVLDELFGEVTYGHKKFINKFFNNLMLIDKTFSGDLTVEQFTDQYGVEIDKNPDSTLSEVIIKHLGHYPEKGESIFLAPFEITVKENTLTEIKTISISTRPT